MGHLRSLPVALVAACVVTTVLCGADRPPLTLEETLRLAGQADVTALLGREGVAQAQAQAAQVRSGVLPNIALAGQQRRTDAVSIANGAALPGTTANRFDGTLSGSYNVLDPQQLAALQAARVGVAVADLDYRASVQAALTEVGQTFFAHLRDVHRIALLDANVEQARALLELADNRLRNGVATQIDVTRARSQLAQAQQARLQQDTVVYQSELLLRRLLNLPPDGPLALADFVVRRAPAGEPAAADRPAAAARRADLLAAQRTLDQARLDVRSARDERLPVLALSGEYGYASANFGDNDKRPEWFAGATVSVPVFDGLRGNADRRLALSRQRAQEYRVRDLARQVSAEIRLAVQDANSRNKQIDVADTGQKLGEEELRLARTRFEQGVADNREVIDAQNTLAQANDNLNEAVYQYNLSRLELARAEGDVRGILGEKAE